MKNIYHKIISSTLIAACAVFLACSGDEDDHPGMVWIPAGEFTMGSSENPLAWAYPEHKVTLTKGFWMSRYLITQEQFFLIMGQAPTHPAYGERRPADGLSWYEAIVFCNRLSIKEGLSPVYYISGKPNPEEWGAIPGSSDTDWNKMEMREDANGYRLPTEAEWEYACRAETESAWNFGQTDANIGLYAWYLSNSENATHKVGQKLPNAWGLYDMLGNVQEWCWDWYDAADDYYLTGPPENPLGVTFGSYRIMRGGGYDSAAQTLRSASRGYDYPYSQGDFIGIRVVRQ